MAAGLRTFAVILALVMSFLPLASWDGGDSDLGSLIGAQPAYAAASVELRQCANGPNNEYPDCRSSGNTGWVGGSVGGSKSSYQEGDFLPYRQVYGDLVVGGEYCFGMTWDVAKPADGLPAIDYIGAFNATLTDVDPTWDTVYEATDPLAPRPPWDDTIAIPPDPALTGTLTGHASGPFTFSGTQQPGVLTIWGGAFDSVGNYSNLGDVDLSTNFEQSLEYCFTATATDVIVAWAGHISKSSQWGAPGLPGGSPYHTANGTKTVSQTGYTSPRTGNTDLSQIYGEPPVENHYNIGRGDVQLAASAVEAFGSIVIIKNTVPDDAQDFSFGVTGEGLSPFILDDDADDTLSNTQTFIDLVAGSGYAVTEDPQSGWDLTGLVCDDPSGGTTEDLGARTATIDLAPGETVECTFTNTLIPTNPPDITVTKTADPTSVLEPGGDVLFTVVVVNSSTSDATLDSLVDDVYGDLNAQGDCSVPQPLAADGGSYSCSFTGAVSGNAYGSQTDTVTATASNEGGSDSASDDAVVTLTDVDSDPLVVEKSTSTPTLPEPGGTFAYQAVVTNPASNVDDIYVTAVVDSIAGDISASCTPVLPVWLAPGESITCNFTFDHSGNPRDSWTNTARATGTDDDGQDASSGPSDEVMVTIDDVRSYLTVEKSTSTPTLPEPGGTFVYQAVVTNPASNVDSIYVTAVVDTIAGDISADCTPALPVWLAPGESITCNFTFDHSGNPGDSWTNTASATGTDDDNQDASSDPSNEVAVTLTDVDPLIDVTKTADPTSIDEGADATVTFSVRVDNDSNASDPVTLDALVDDTYGNLLDSGNLDVSNNTCAALAGTTIQPGGHVECSFDATVPAGDVGDTATDRVDATASDDDAGGNDATDFDTADVTYDAVDPVIDVTKTADQAQVFQPGENVVFTVLIENDSVSTDPVTINSLIDSIHGDIADPTNTSIVDTICSVPQTIQPGDSYQCTFSALVDGDETDKVTASGADDENTAVSDFDEATVEMINPSVDIEKSTNGEDADTAPGPEILVGESVVWVYKVTNDGDVDLTDIVVTDDELGDVCTITSLAVGDSTTYTMYGTSTADGYANTGIADVTYTDADNDQAPRSDSDDSHYFGADPSFTIEKQVSVDGGTTWFDADSISGPELLDGYAAPQFRVIASNTGNVDIIIDVGDSDLPALSASNVSLEVGDTDVPVAGPVGSSWAEGQQSNTATADGSYTDENGNEWTNEQTDDAKYFGANPSYTIEKQISADGGITWLDADAATGPELLAGYDAPRFRVLVSNTGNVDITVDVNDPSLPGLNTTNVTVPAGATNQVVASASTAWAAGQWTNTATVDGSYVDDANNQWSDSQADDANYFGANPSIAIVKSTADEYGNEGDGIGILPGEVVTWNYHVTNDGNAALQNVRVSDDQGVTVVYDSEVSGNSDGVFDPGEEWLFKASGLAAEGWYNNTGTAEGDYSDSAGNSTTVDDSDTSSYYGLTPGVVTNSSLCDFGENFRLIFTPDFAAGSNLYKISDSNPGQFFYNVFHVGEADSTVTLELPYPFVTQGGNPVHVYGGVFVNPEGEGGINCFDPRNELASQPSIVTLADYPGDFGSVTTVNVTIQESGFVYVNIHLDYGLEKTSGWKRSDLNALNVGATDPGLQDINIENLWPHTFSADAGAVLIDGSEDTITNNNEFKRLRGIGGLVKWEGTGDPVPGRTVRVYDAAGTLLDTAETDIDGWYYFLTWVPKGKAQEYTVVEESGATKVVTLGGRVKWAQEDFLITP